MDVAVMVGVPRGVVVLTDEQVAELRAVANSRDVPAVVEARARIVLWTAEGRMRKDVGVLAGYHCPLWTVGSIGTNGSGWPAWRSTNVVPGGSRSRRGHDLQPHQLGTFKPDRSAQSA
jgi:hypothetical protein